MEKSKEKKQKLSEPINQGNATSIEAIKHIPSYLTKEEYWRLLLGSNKQIRNNIGKAYKLHEHLMRSIHCDRGQLKNKKTKNHFADFIKTSGLPIKITNLTGLDRIRKLLEHPEYSEMLDGTTLEIFLQAKQKEFAKSFFNKASEAVKSFPSSIKRASLHINEKCSASDMDKFIGEFSRLSTESNITELHIDSPNNGFYNNEFYTNDTRNSVCAAYLHRWAPAFNIIDIKPPVYYSTCSTKNFTFSSCDLIKPFIDTDGLQELTLTNVFSNGTDISQKPSTINKLHIQPSTINKLHIQLGFLPSFPLKNISALTLSAKRGYDAWLAPDRQKQVLDVIPFLEKLEHIALPLRIKHENYMPIVIQDFDLLSALFQSILKNCKHFIRIDLCLKGHGAPYNSLSEYSALINLIDPFLYQSDRKKPLHLNVYPMRTRLQVHQEWDFFAISLLTHNIGTNLIYNAHFLSKIIYYIMSKEEASATECFPAMIDALELLFVENHADSPAIENTTSSMQRLLNNTVLRHQDLLRDKLPQPRSPTDLSWQQSITDYPKLINVFLSLIALKKARLNMLKQGDTILSGIIHHISKNNPAIRKNTIKVAELQQDKLVSLLRADTNYHRGTNEAATSAAERIAEEQKSNDLAKNQQILTLHRGTSDIRLKTTNSLFNANPIALLLLSHIITHKIKQYETPMPMPTKNVYREDETPVFTGHTLRPGKSELFPRPTALPHIENFRQTKLWDAIAQARDNAANTF